MRLTLEGEIEYAIWKITGFSCRYHSDLLPSISRMLAEKTGEDPGEISMALVARIKEIIREDVSLHYRRLCGGISSPVSCHPVGEMCHD
ncbi:MAG: hypothetical protein A4E38_01425 [Methanoregulaceae archaeon PtaB.Bin108]|nr:MAG: hypothetical protein A4E38_01425 [Methanoregulaceae archaeon PtaB.Bin108]OPY44273.1 MAG: hypothetical protein A4E42_01053 [Methanoregulaceae archaeon PtaU1.Bin222]